MSEIDFGDWLMNELNNRGWSQAELARKSSLTPQAISNYINDPYRKPDTEALRKIAKAFGLPETVVYYQAGQLSDQIEPGKIAEQITAYKIEAKLH
jgi:transcriptional regulator with XRE-family HTH domain